MQDGHTETAQLGTEPTAPDQTGSAAIGAAKAEIQGLIHDVTAYVAAERALWTGRAAFTGKTLKSAAIVGVILAGLVIGMLTVLALGGLLILDSFFGPVAATLILAGGMTVLIAILAFLLTRTVKSLKFNDRA